MYKQLTLWQALENSIYDTSCQPRRLDDVCTLQNLPDYMNKEERANNQGDIPYYGANGIIDYVNQHNFEGQAILIGCRGSVITKQGTPILHFVQDRAFISSLAIIAACDNPVMLRYLYWRLNTTRIGHLVRGSNIKGLRLDDVAAIKISMPPDTEIRRIVSLVDNLAAAYRDKDRETRLFLAAANKRNEYYRDRLYSILAALKME